MTYVQNYGTCRLYQRAAGIQHPRMALKADLIPNNDAGVVYDNVESQRKQKSYL